MSKQNALNTKNTLGICIWENYIQGQCCMHKCYKNDTSSEKWSSDCADTRLVWNSLHMFKGVRCRRILYFMLSSEINAYQKQIKVISITSEVIWYQSLVTNISLYLYRSVFFITSDFSIHLMQHISKVQTPITLVSWKHRNFHSCCALMKILIFSTHSMKYIFVFTSKKFILYETLLVTSWDIYRPSEQYMR